MSGDLHPGGEPKAKSGCGPRDLGRLRGERDGWSAAGGAGGGGRGVGAIACSPGLTCESPGEGGGWGLGLERGASRTGPGRGRPRALRDSLEEREAGRGQQGMCGGEAFPATQTQRAGDRCPPFPCLRGRWERPPPGLGWAEPPGCCLLPRPQGPTSTGQGPVPLLPWEWWPVRIDTSGAGWVTSARVGPPMDKGSCRCVHALTLGPSLCRALQNPLLCVSPALTHKYLNVYSRARKRPTARRQILLLWESA